MRTIIIIITASFIFKYSPGQTQCPKKYFDKIKQAELFLRSNNPVKAFEVFKNAQSDGKVCNLKSTVEAEDGMKRAFFALSKMYSDLKIANKKLGFATIALEKNASVETKKELNQTGYFSFKYEVTDVTNEKMNLVKVSLSRNYSSSNIFSTSVFAQTKYLLDSIWNFYNVNHMFPNNLDNEAAMSQLIDRLDKDIKFNIVAKKIFDSSKIELQKLIPGTSGYDFTVYTYLRAVLYYSWNLTSKGKDSLILAKKILDDAAEFCNTIPYKSAIIYSAMAGLYNSYNNYYNTIDYTGGKEFQAIKTALEYGANAVRLNPGSYLYQRSLATLLRNTTYSSDSQLSLMDKVELSRLAYKCLKNMEVYFPYSGNSLAELCKSSANLANRLMDIGFYNNATDTLKNTIEVTNQYITKKITTRDVELNKLKLLTRIASVYVDSLNNFNSGMKYLNESYAFFSNIKQDTTGNVDAERLVELNASLDNILKCAITKQDSLSAITTFSAAIQAYEKISPLNRPQYKTFSEYVYRYAQPYVRRLELNILRNNKEDSEKDFAVLEKIFLPYYYKYPFDFYLGQPLVKANKLYANYLCEQGKYKKALPLLKFASLEGIKGSTDSLIAIYQKPGFSNTDSLKFYKQRTSYQSNGMKRFTVPAELNGEKFPLYVYISDRAKEYDTMYTGIRDQAQWFEQARGGRIPDDVTTSFDKLQKIAWENDVSFMDLSVYALGVATQDSVSKTEEPLQTEESLKAEIDTKTRGKTIKEMLGILLTYSAKNDSIAIRYIANKIQYSDSVSDKNMDNEKIYYQLLTEKSVKSIRLLNKKTVPIYRNIILNKSPFSLASNDLIREYYLKLSTLDSIYYLQLTVQDKAQEDSAIGAHYNSLAWYSLLTKKYSGVYEYLMLSKKHDSKSVYPDSNIPHYYLFTNQIQKAKTEYLNLRNKPFLPNSPKLKTFKSAFIADFEDFEREGIMNDNIKEIIRLLNEK